MKNAFVYGTLRKGSYNHYLLQEKGTTNKVTCLGKGRVKGKMYNVGGYPKAVLDREGTGEHSFVVEAYEVNAVVEKMLDNLELPFGYKKEVIAVEITNDAGNVLTVKGIIYHVLPQEHILREETLIEDWIEYIAGFGAPDNSLED